MAAGGFREDLVHVVGKDFEGEINNESGRDIVPG